MSLLDVILGRTRREPSRDDPLIALSSSVVTLRAELGFLPSGQAGIVIRPVESEAYRRADADLSRLLDLAGRETGATIARRTDAYGYQWVVVADDDVADLVASAYQVSIQLRDAGFGDEVLAAAFGFRDADGRPAYLLYNFKRAAFYPFLPGPAAGSRDTAREFQLAAALGREIPVEPDQSRWYPMWGMPLDGAPSGAPSASTRGDGGRDGSAGTPGHDAQAAGDQHHVGGRSRGSRDDESSRDRGGC